MEALVTRQRPQEALSPTTERFVGRRRNVKEAEGTKDRLIKTLRDLVSFQTISNKEKTHADEFRKLFDYVGEKVQEASQQTGRQFVTKEWNNDGFLSTIITPKDPNRPDEEALLQPKIAMLIHADVVNAEDPSMFTMQQDGDNLKGRGVLDMKQGLAIGLDLLPDLPVGASVIVTSDEELGGEKGAKFLAEQVGLQPEFLIVLDGQRPEYVSFGGKGLWHAQLTFSSLLNIGGHGSRHEDYGATELAMDLRNKLREIYPWKYGDAPEGTTVNFGKANGGMATNKIAENFVMSMDMRFETDEDKKVGKEDTKNACYELVKQTMQQIYGNDIPVHLAWESKVVEGKEVSTLKVIDKDNANSYSVIEMKTLSDDATYSIDENNPIIQRFCDIMQKKTGVATCMNGKDMGLNDGRFWPKVPALLYLPKGFGPHMSNETVSATGLTQTREGIHQLLQEELVA